METAEPIPDQTPPPSKAPEGFSAMPYPVRSFASLGTGRYLVYTEDGKRVAVDAETAAEALKSSGVATPARIKRDMPKQETLIGINRMLGNTVN